MNGNLGEQTTKEVRNLMISEQHRLVFIHVPKTAGNSLQTYFHEAWGVPFTKIEKSAETFELRDVATQKKHQTLRAYQKVLGKDFDSYTVAWVWRNPFDRIASWYFSQHRLPRRPARRLIFRARLSFADFQKFASQKPNMAHYLGLDRPPFPAQFLQMQFDQLPSSLKSLETLLGISSKPSDLPRINSAFDAGKRIEFAERLKLSPAKSTLHHQFDFQIRGGTRAEIYEHLWRTAKN